MHKTVLHTENIAVRCQTWYWNNVSEDYLKVARYEKTDAAKLLVADGYILQYVMCKFIFLQSLSSYIQLVR